jgi:hypothetical protein
MTHGQTLREDKAPRIKAPGIFRALLPMQTFYWGDWYVDTVLGPGRAPRAASRFFVTLTQLASCDRTRRGGDALRP